MEIVNLGVLRYLCSFYWVILASCGPGSAAGLFTRPALRGSLFPNCFGETD